MSRRIVALLAAVGGLLVPAAASSQTTISNTQKYQDTSQSTAKGRTGGASLYARMLYGKNGATDVELSTADFDTGAAPIGTLSKVSLRGVNGEGTEMFQLNYGPLTNNGSWAQSFSSFAPGQPFHIYGLVRTTRNDLVVLSATVRRRPDLAARNLIAPQQGTTGSPIQIAATVAELNGHVGARADCVLYANDLEVDRANGIWVDSGDEVSCAFSHTFDAPGTYALRVAAEAVRPGDWDSDNNSVSGSLDVVTPTIAYNYASANVWDYDDYDYDYYESGHYNSSSSGNDWSYESHQHHESYSGISYYAYRYMEGSQVIAAMDFSATDGATTWSSNVAVNACSASGSTLMNNRTVSWWAYGCGGYLEVHFQALAGTVTYMSRNYYRSFRRDASGNVVYDPPSEYFSNSSQNYGPHQLTGGVIQVNAIATMSDGTVYSTPLSVSLSAPQLYTASYGDCSSSSNGGASSSYCYSYSYSYTARSGYVSAYAP